MEFKLVTKEAKNPRTLYPGVFNKPLLFLIILRIWKLFVKYFFYRQM